MYILTQAFASSFYRNAKISSIAELSCFVLPHHQQNGSTYSYELYSAPKNITCVFPEESKIFTTYSFIFWLLLHDSFRSVNFKNSCRWPQPPLPRRNHLGWDGGSRGWRPRCPSISHRPLQRSLEPSQIWTGWYAAPKHIPASWGSVCHDHDPMIISSISHCIVWHCC